MNDTKTFIKSIVDEYKKMFPDEYQLVVKGVKAKKQLTRDQYASIEGSFEGRGLYEISETLFSMLVMRLNEEDMMWLKRGGLNGKEGGRWFAKTYPEFALPDKI